MSAYDIKVGAAVVTLIVVAIGAVAALMWLRIKSLSVNHRNLYRLAVTFTLILSMALVAFVASEEDITSENTLRGFSACLLVFLLACVGHLAYWIIEKLIVKRLIRVSGMQSQARREGRFKDVYRHQREIVFLKKRISGSVKELEDAGILI